MSAGEAPSSIPLDALWQSAARVREGIEEHAASHIG
jgi:hypothetical protein